VLDYRTRGTGPKSVQALWGSTLSWTAYGPFIEKNTDLVAAFSAANNEAIAWILEPHNRDELYRLIEQRMPLPDAVTARSDTLRRIIDLNSDLLGAGVAREPINGWNSYLMSLNQIPSAVSYDEMVWKTARP